MNADCQMGRQTQDQLNVSQPGLMGRAGPPSRLQKVTVTSLSTHREK